MEELTFSPFDYYLDQSDPDVVILRRQDGSFVAAFSARGVTKKGILKAAKEDRLKRLRSRATDCIALDHSVGELKSSR